MSKTAKGLLRLPRPGPAERVGLGLASIIVAAILVLDFAFNIFPDDLDAVRDVRARVSEQLAVQAGILLDSGGVSPLSVAMLQWVKREVSKGLQAPDESDRFEAELAALDAEIANVVDAIAHIGMSPALQSKLNELELRKIQVEAELSMTQRTVQFPNTSDIQEVWTGLVENIGDVHSDASEVEMQALRNGVKGLIGQIRVARDGMGSADLCLQSMVAGAGFEPATFGL